MKWNILIVSFCLTLFLLFMFSCAREKHDRHENCSSVISNQVLISAVREVYKDKFRPGDSFPNISIDIQVVGDSSYYWVRYCGDVDYLFYVETPSFITKADSFPVAIFSTLLEPFAITKSTLYEFLHENFPRLWAAYLLLKLKHPVDIDDSPNLVLYFIRSNL